MLVRIKFRCWTGAALAGCVFAAGAAANGAQPADADTLMKTCDLDRAEALAQEGLKKNADDPEALRLLGRAMIARDQFKEAIALLEQAAALKPDSAETYFYQGEARLQYAAHAPMLKKFGLAGGARDAYLRAVELAPENARYRAPLVTYYAAVPGIAGGSMKKARAHAVAIAKSDPLEGAYQQAYIAAVGQEEEEARKLLQELAVKGHTPSALLLAQLSAKAGQPEAAFAAVDGVLKKHPGDLAALYTLGLVAGVTGQQLERGETALQSYLSNPRNRCQVNAKIARASAYYGLGEIYRKSKRVEQARASYKASLEAFPDFAQAENALDDLPDE